MDTDVLKILIAAGTTIIAAVIGYVFNFRSNVELARRATEEIRHAESRVEAEPEKAKPAWDLARATLESYFNRNLSQIASIFWLSLFVMLIGFGVIIVGIFESMRTPAAVAPGAIATAAGIITEFIGATFLFIYRSTSSTPLHWAAGDRVCAPNARIARLLLEKGAEVDAKTGAGNTPLIWAAKCKEEGALAVAEVLLEYGADLNYYGDDGTAVSAAREEGTPAMVDLLHGRRKASLPGNRRLGKPEGVLARLVQFLGLMRRTPRCPECRSFDVEQTDILPKREVWKCNACKHDWSFWYPPYQHRNKKR